MNKEFIRMQKLAGLITEGVYTTDVKASLEAMSHDSESRMTKRKLKEKIKEMMTPIPDEDEDSNDECEKCNIVEEKENKKTNAKDNTKSKKQSINKK